MKKIKFIFSLLYIFSIGKIHADSDDLIRELNEKTTEIDTKLRQTARQSDTRTRWTEELVTCTAPDIGEDITTTSKDTITGRKKGFCLFPSMITAALHATASASHANDTSSMLGEQQLHARLTLPLDHTAGQKITINTGETLTPFADFARLQAATAMISARSGIGTKETNERKEIAWMVKTKDPALKGITCNGEDLTLFSPDYVQYLLRALNNQPHLLNELIILFHTDDSLKSVTIEIRGHELEERAIKHEHSHEADVQKFINLLCQEFKKQKDNPGRGGIVPTDAGYSYEVSPLKQAQNGVHGSVKITLPTEKFTELMHVLRYIPHTVAAPVKTSPEVKSVTAVTSSTKK